MTTFSQLVDDIVKELLRPDMKDTIATYTNQTIRDVHFRPNVNSPILYDANRYESEEPVLTDGTWLWSIPSNTRFQDVEAIFIEELGVYVKRKNPRVALEQSFEPDANLYWYRSGPAIAIQGVVAGWTAKFSYHMFPRTLGYKPTAGANARLIQFDADADEYTLIAGGAPSEAQLETETHWILQRWADSVKEGVRAKIWKRLGDMERTRMAYSAFESMRTSIWNTEPSS